MYKLEIVRHNKYNALNTCITNAMHIIIIEDATRQEGSLEQGVPYVDMEGLAIKARMVPVRHARITIGSMIAKSAAHW
jgi:hypothetical protein